jgi:3'(2'), 5'-bisphosphate nucleotidase
MLPYAHIKIINKILKEAGDHIVDLYNKGDYKVEHKSDQSPLTSADSGSEMIILSALKSLFPNIPLISEESAPHHLSEKPMPYDYWISDPLDGTKEFIKGNGEFCICLARITGGEVIEGYIYAPLTGNFWFAIRGEGSFSIVDDRPVKLPCLSQKEGIIVLKSRSHTGLDEERWIGKISEIYKVEEQQQGSAIKFCRIAEGSGDIYIKFGVINKWDVAAGALIVEEANGAVYSLSSLERLSFDTSGYNVDPFIVTGHKINRDVLLKMINLTR